MATPSRTPPGGWRRRAKWAVCRCGGWLRWPGIRGRRARGSTKAPRPRPGRGWPQRRAGTIPNRGGERTPECWYRRRSFAAAFVYSLPDLGPGERLLQTSAVHGAVLEAEPDGPPAGFAEAFAQAI